MDKFKVNWYTLCWNEIDIVKYIIDYWINIKNQVDLNVIVYDNGSNDGCLNELSKYDWIEIRHFDSEGMDDIIQMNVKNNCWKESKGKVDYVIVSDFDEILWGDLNQELVNMKTNNYNILCTKWYALCGENIPTYTKGKYLHQLVKRGYKQKINHDYVEYGKIMVFNPNLINDMNWDVGNHKCNPKPISNILFTDKIIAFHVNKGFGKEYFYNKRNLLSKRLSLTNLRNNLCYEYRFSKEIMFNEYQGYLDNSIDISNL